MTLSTSVHPLDTIDHRLLFLLARKVANIPAEWPFTESADAIIHHPGVPGAVCRVDAFLHESAAEYAAKYGEAPDDSWRAGWEVQFDTPYGFDGPNGETCDQIHARLVLDLLTELMAHGVAAEWQDEYTGQWYTLPPVGTVHEWGHS